MTAYANGAREPWEYGPPEGFGDDGDFATPLNGAQEQKPPEDAAPQRTPPATPAQIVERWRGDGPLVRVATGIRALDDACRGGLPIPWRVIIVGAPSAGKTCIAIIIARVLASRGVCVGVLAVDEEPDDLTVRLAQMAGFTVAQAEGRSPDVLDAIRAAVADLRMRLYDATWTIDDAAADLAGWAKAEGMWAALFIDSIQAARSRGSPTADTARAIVEANVASVRGASTTHRMLVVGTSEANRASYRNDQAAADSNDLAAGAESRAIEFGAGGRCVTGESVPGVPGTVPGTPAVCRARRPRGARGHGTPDAASLVPAQDRGRRRQRSP